MAQRRRFFSLFLLKAILLLSTCLFATGNESLSTKQPLTTTSESQKQLTGATDSLQETVDPHTATTDQSLTTMITEFFDSEQETIELNTSVSTLNSSFIPTTSPTQLPTNSSIGNGSSTTPQIVDGFTNTSESHLFTPTDTVYTEDTFTEVITDAGYFCDEGWFSYGNFCYWKSDIKERINWMAARVRCQQDGADLVSFHSFEEEQYVIENYLRGASDAQHWIGFHDIHKEGSFEWSDGSPVNYIHWADKQPDNWIANYGEDCSQIRIIDYVWNDDACGAHQSWLCKKPKGIARNIYETACFYNQPNRTIVMQSYKDYFIWTPSYPHYYPHDLACLWLLQSDINTHIRVEIQDVYFLCDLDTVTFGDGHDPSDESSTILSRQTNVKTRVLYSQTDKMWIQWSPVACPAIDLPEALRYFLDFATSYSDMNYQLPFPFLMMSEQIMTNVTNNTYGFYMKVTSLQDTDFLPCPNDTYSCSDGGCSLLSSLCNNLQDCGDNSDENICVSDNFQLAPTFDAFKQHQFFNMSTDTIYIFTSPNYPSAYMNYLNASWVISVPISKKIRLEIKDFQVRSYDLVRVGDGSNMGEDAVWIGTGGSTKLRVILSREESLWIQMTSSVVYATKGFVFHVATFIDKGGGIICTDYGFKCFINGYCIDNEGVCDGMPDCPDGSDEFECDCDSMDIAFIAGECHLPLGLQYGLIKDDQITASSHLNDSHRSYYARLRNETYWAPEADDIAPWIQIRFTRPLIISGLVVQGAGFDSTWVQEFTLTYSSDGEKWTMFNDVLENSNLIEGNKDPFCPNVIRLNLAIQAQYVRVHPLSSGSEIGMRMEMFGCYDNDCDYTFGMISGDIRHDQIQSSSSFSPLNDFTTARISLFNQHGYGWIPASDDQQPWLEITLDHLHNIVALTTQGCGNEDFWVTSYSLSYSARSSRLIHYRSESQTMIFEGNSNRNEIVKNELIPSIEAIRVRIHPVTWNRGICIRSDLSGCAKEIPECAIGHSACNNVHLCNTPTARLASAGYPHTYLIRSRCAWQIQTPVGTFTSLKFLDFDVPSWDTCESTYLNIYDGLTDSDDLIGSFCNYNIPPSELISGFNEMFLRFQAGQEEPGTGFLIEYNSQVFMDSNSTDEQSEGDCLEGWLPWRKNCYIFVREEEPLKWTSAEENCKQYGGNLASISSEDEMNVIHSLLIENRAPRWSKCYIGLRLLGSSSEYRWTNGRPLSYTDWFAPLSLDKWDLRQPDGGSLEACTVIELASLHSTDNWKDVPCASEETNQYVCATKQVGDRYSPTSEPTLWSQRNENECSSTMFTCIDSGECLHTIFVCDGYNDCNDGSDEQSCEIDTTRISRPYEIDQSCLPGRFLCGSGECISVSYVCDFTSQCMDNSDENWCYLRACNKNEFRCANGQCIDRHLRCDLGPDCADESDEFECEETKSGFQCYDGTWIPLHRYCDGQRDCSGKNWEDEPIQCVSKTCENDELRCTNGACVAADTNCQYGAGCRDASHLQSCEHFECDNTTIKCPLSFCIRLSHRCNGVMDCPNGEDEIGCESFNCPGAYRCHGNQFCIQQIEVCDGHKDCPDGDDELLCELPCPDNCHCDGLYYDCKGLDWSSSSKNVTMGVRQLRLTDVIYSQHGIEHTSSGNILLVELQMFKSLIVIEVRRASISHVLPGVFAPHRNLRQLVLSDNKIEVLQNATFDGLISLQFLDISGNPITNVHTGTFLALQGLLFINIRGTLIKRPTPEIFQHLHQLDTLYSDKYVFCCMVRDLPTVTECLPEADQFSSCEDLMRNQVLRIFMWILGISALLGNGFVIFWRIIPHGQNKTKKSKANIVQSTLVLNLAMADGLMGVYMLIIASADMIYRGVYIVYAEDWQESIICKVAGFLSVLSSETSVFFMTIISIDRFLSIIMPFSNVNLTPKTAKMSALLIWGLAFTVSIIPVLVQGYFGSEYYGRSSVCLALPLTTERPAGWEYSVALFLCVNLLAFAIILICYLAIYILVKLSARQTVNTRKNNMSQQIEFAMRMAFLVGTDFICWMPIIIMGFLSLTEAATIPPIVYVWSAVFLLPINSSLNPYLFTILTREMTKQKARKSKRVTITKSSGVAATKSFTSEANHSELKLSNLIPNNIDGPTRQVMPILENPYILAKALHEGEMYFTSEDLEVIERDLKKAFDYCAQNGIGIKRVTEDDILIDKRPGGGTTQAFLMMNTRHSDSNTMVTNNNVESLRNQFQELCNELEESWN